MKFWPSLLFFASASTCVSSIFLVIGSVANALSPYVYPQYGGTCESVRSCMREDLNRLISQLASPQPGYEQYPNTNPEVSYIKQNPKIFQTYFLTVNNSLQALGIALMFRWVESEKC